MPRVAFTLPYTIYPPFLTYFLFCLRALFHFQKFVYIGLLTYLLQSLLYVERPTSCRISA